MRTFQVIDDIVSEIKKFLLKHYGEKIKKVIVYGSFAKGEATTDSDIDILVVVDDSLDPRKVEEKLDDLLFEILLNRNELVSVIAVNETMFENYRSPLLLNVKEEGITV